MTEAVYTRSTGQVLACDAMPFPHLVSAYRGLLKRDPDHHELAGMAAEIAKREAEHAAKQEQDADQ